MGIFSRFYRKVVKGNIWARPEMDVVFRAELMPGKSRDERIFRVREVLPTGRVKLHGLETEHRENEFERVRTQP